jgi:hypothetical protein
MKDGGDALEALDSLRSLYQACRPGVHGLAGAPLRPPLSWEMEDYSSKMPSRTSWRDWFAAQQEDLVCEELALAPSDKFWQPSESFVIFSSSAHHPRLGVAIKGCSCPKGEGGFDMRVEIDEGTPHRLWTSAVLFLERFHGLFIRVSFKEGLRLVVPTELWFRCVRRWREA